MGIQSNAVTLVRLTSETKQSDFFFGRGGGGREGGSVTPSRNVPLSLPRVLHLLTDAKPQHEGVQINIVYIFSARILLVGYY